MIVLTATLILIIAAVFARAGVATSSGSIHSLDGHFALSGDQLSGPSAGKLFVYGIVVRIDGLLGFSMLPGAPTCLVVVTSRTGSCCDCFCGSPLRDILVCGGSCCFD